MFAFALFVCWFVGFVGLVSASVAFNCCCLLLLFACDAVLGY